MLEFHRQLKPAAGRAQPPVRKSEALRQAALKLMKTGEYGHPFYWAGFVVIGDARCKAKPSGLLAIRRNCNPLVMPFRFSANIKSSS
jgi:hypothetical protein